LSLSFFYKKRKVTKEKNGLIVTASKGLGLMLSYFARQTRLRLKQVANSFSAALKNL